MALHIDVNDLLKKRKIESNRIEFKAGWNPDKIYHSICAFANDRDNLGGGYILVGVEEENGIAKRPVKGLAENEIDKIQKQMVAFNAKISPFCIPHVDVEEVDDKFILIIWVPTGAYRPYSVSESVLAKKSVPKYYVRSGSNSIEAKGEVMDELRELATRIPFDDRGNPQITVDDISPTLLLTHLLKVKSRLADDFHNRNLMDVLEQMDLLVGPSENRWIKNVAAMMFCDHPEKFFPYTQIDIVLFPEGVINNPNNMIEAPKIVGPVPQMIEDALRYLRTTVIKEQIIKPKDRAESIRFFNYPYQALEEAVVNSMYHRSYEEREPVEIRVEPDHIDILSYAGPDRSISMDAIREAHQLTARRYRNRRLGDFLKELELSEGRATGIPTIQDELKKNGSSSAKIDTDDERSYFLIQIPCHEGFTKGDVTKNVTKNVTKKPKLSERQKTIISLISENPYITHEDMANKFSVVVRTVKRDTTMLAELGLIRHVGPTNGGYWEILNKE